MKRKCIFQGGSLEYKKYYSILNSRRQRLQKQVKKIEKSLSLSKNVHNSTENVRVTRENKVYNFIQDYMYLFNIYPIHF